MVDSTGGDGAVRREMTNSRGVSRKAVFMAVLMVYGFVLFSVAHYLKIDATTTKGNVIMQDFVNSRDTKEQLAEKIREIKGINSVTSLLKIEERK